eukprot:g12150.t1
MGATSANMEVYVRLSEANAAGEFELDSSVGSSLSQSGRFDTLGSAFKNHEGQDHSQQRQQQGAGLEASDNGLVTGSGTGFAPRSEVGRWQQQQQQQQQQGAEAAGEERPSRPSPPVPLRRREGMSDVWQQQGAFRSNRKSMKSMFEEFAAELNSPENEGKPKAELGDIFSYTSVGHKHLVRDAPTEDRVAIHQAVVPTIDEADKEELGIDSIDTTPFAMFGVFDGHGGAACAEFLEKSVSTVLAHSPVLFDEDLTPTQRRACATADSFEELEKVHNDWAHQSGDLSGSTAILSTFQDGVLVMAGVGDSAGLYVDHMGNQHNLCPQHSTSNKREVERVLSMGGTIVNNRVAGCLMPTRTIGDLDCKRALGAIVSPHPELKLAAIYAPPDDGEIHDEPFLVIASDGLWDVLSFAQVSFITRKGLRTLRAQERKDRQRAEKLAAKAAHKASSSSGGGGGGEGGAAASAPMPGNGASPGDGADKKSRWKSMFKRESRLSKASSTSDLGGTGHSSANHNGLGGGGGGGFGKGRRNNSNSNFPGSAVLPPPAGIGGVDMSKTGWMDASRGSFMDGSRSSGQSGFMDTSIRGLDASVRHGQRGQIAAASLDSSLYAGLRAEQSRLIMTDTSLREGVPADGTGSLTAPSPILSGDLPELPSYVKPVMTTATDQTASVRTAGSAGQNVAMQLVHAAQRADSHDDISVVVVTFTGTEDKSAPGSRHLQRKGSTRSLSGSSTGHRSGPVSIVKTAPDPAAAAVGPSAGGGGGGGGTEAGGAGS